MSFIIENSVLKKYTGNDTEVVIPEGVTAIGAWAFSRCKHLTSVVIPGSVSTIDHQAFAHCSSLSSIVIPDSVTTVVRPFTGCENLPLDMLPGHLWPTNQNMYAGYAGLLSFTIPDGVAAIEAEAFYNCWNLSSIVIPDSVREIGQGAFTGCTSLTSITIPPHVTAIVGSVFAGCSSLSQVSLPQGITSIGNHAFLDCGSLTSIAFPQSVAKIGRRVFSGCGNLASVTIPENARKKYDEKILDRCENLREAFIPYKIAEKENPQTKQTAAITYCVSPQQFSAESQAAYSKYISAQRKKLMERIAQEDNAAAIRYFIDNDLVTIKNIDDYTQIANTCSATEVLSMLLEFKNAYIKQSDLEVQRDKELQRELDREPKQAKQPDIWSFAKIDAARCRVTAYNGSDTAVVVPNKQGERTVTEISTTIVSRGTFKQLTSITMPASIEAWMLRDIKFEQCRRLQEVILEEGIKEIYEKAFYGCKKLETVVIPDSMRDILWSAFEKCVSLRSIMLPRKMRSIDSKAFASCKALNTVTIRSVKARIADDAFDGCDKHKLTIYAPKDSMAAAFAQKQRIRFEELNA